jgi:alpha-amylase
LADLKNFASGYLPDGDAVLFVDNHDTQRGHGPGHDILSFFEAKLYKIANAFMLAWPYGVAQVMSSYYFTFDKDWQGPPSNSNGETKDVVINA